MKLQDKLGIDIKQPDSESIASAREFLFRYAYPPTQPGGASAGSQPPRRSSIGGCLPERQER